MLTTCPECELQVSTKAVTCPHCGYPLNEEVKNRRTKSKTNKRRRLPNGFGQISEIKNRNLRKPFRAMITVGKDANGKPICKPLKPDSYFSTYNDAYAALVEYNRSPYDLSPAITVKELHERWFEDYSKKVKSTELMELAWKYCNAVYNMRVIDLRPHHIKDCINNGEALIRNKIQKANPHTQSSVKTLFNLMLNYALEYEIVERNCSKAFSLDAELIQKIKENKTEHIPYTDKEMDTLWNHVQDSIIIKMILIQCYSGWRPGELFLLRLEDIDLEKRLFKGGIKTEAGKNRMVPIHSKIYSLIEEIYHESLNNHSEYLFNLFDIKSDTFVPFTHKRYDKRFNEIIGSLRLNKDHRGHDGRKHFVTAAKKSNVDEYAIKYIIGHRIDDITEKVYTQRDFEWLESEIEKIK